MEPVIIQKGKTNNLLNIARCAVMVSLLGCLAGGHLLCHAQEPEKQKLTFQSVMNRFSLSTNALDWLITVPNLQVEYDLSGGQYNNKSIQLGIRYNWNTWHQKPAYYVFNIMDVRGEYRYHFRFTQRRSDEKFKFFSFERKNPHVERAYYIGAYGSYSTYSVKPAANGIQGWKAGLGAVIGYELPLYEYKKSAVDLDLGLAAGVDFSMYDVYHLSPSHDNYVMSSSGWYVLPMITEIRAAFTFRSSTVKDKYVVRDPQIKEYNNALETIRTNFEGTSRQVFFESKDNRTRELYSKNDSLYRASFVQYVEEEVQNNLNNVKELETGGYLNKQYIKKLENAIQQYGKKCISNFDAEVRKEKAEQMRKEIDEEKEAMKKAFERDRQDRKQEKEDAKNQKKERRDADMHE